MFDTIAEITLPEVEVPFYTQNNIKNSSIKAGLWCDYEAVWKLNKKSLKVKPVINITDFGENDVNKEIDLFFDPKEWDTQTLGLMYTDPIFENNFEEIWHQYYKFPKHYGTPSYTEQGMQGDSFISMETRLVKSPPNWWAGFTSAHEAITTYKHLKNIGAKIVFADSVSNPISV